MFSVFVHYLQSSSISNLVDFIEVDLTPTMADPYLLGDKQSCIAIVRTSETTSIEQQGFKTQHRIKLAFEYDIAIYSKQSAAYCAEIGQAVETYLNNNERTISITYGDVLYNIYINPFVRTPSWNNETNFWQDIMKITGFMFTKEI